MLLYNSFVAKYILWRETNMRLIDGDWADAEMRKVFSLPEMIGEMDNPDAREGVTALNIITAARTIIPGRDDDLLQCFVIAKSLPPEELVILLRKMERRKPRSIGARPKILYGLAADCIEKLMEAKP